MPFTLAHSAAALPFRRSPFVFSALIIGTLAPDFEYFLRLTPSYRFGHTLLGAFVLTLPLALIVLWMFHNLVKVPAARLMPDSIQRRLAPYLVESSFGGPRRFLLIIASALLGIATHLLWDSFTHRDMWATKRWAVFRHLVHFPVFGAVPYYKVLQHGSTLLGTTIVIVWLVMWYRRSAPAAEPLSHSPPTARRLAIVAAIVAIASAGALIRAMLGAGKPMLGPAISVFVGEAISTWIALSWWLLVILGLFARSRGVVSASRPETV